MLKHFSFSTLSIISLFLIFAGQAIAKNVEIKAYYYKPGTVSPHVEPCVAMIALEDENLSGVQDKIRVATLSRAIQNYLGVHMPGYTIANYCLGFRTNLEPNESIDRSSLSEIRVYLEQVKDDCTVIGFDDYVAIDFPDYQGWKSLYLEASAGDKAAIKRLFHRLIEQKNNILVECEQALQPGNDLEGFIIPEGHEGPKLPCRGCLFRKESEKTEAMYQQLSEQTQIVVRYMWHDAQATKITPEQLAETLNSRNVMENLRRVTLLEKKGLEELLEELDELS